MTKTEFIRDHAQHGHYRQHLAETAVALAEAYCRADDNNKRWVLTHLLETAEEYFHKGLGWSDDSVFKASQAIRKSLW